MPIKHLTTSSGNKLFRLGIIRKGGKKRGNQFGQDLDHFRFDCKDKRLEQALNAHYQNKPDKLAVQLPYRTVEENFPTWMEDYNANSLKVQCDGERIQIYLDKETQRYDRPRNMPCMRNKGCSCKEVGRLLVILPLAIESGYIGYFELQTHSKHDIVAIDSYLRDMYDRCGDLRSIPFEVYRYPQEISTRYEDKEGKARRSRQEKQLVGIRVHPMAVKQMREQFLPSNQLLSSKTENRQLPAYNPVIEPQDQIKQLRQLQGIDDEF